MKSLNYKQLSLLASELDSTLNGNHIPNIVVVNSSDILFSFSFYRKEKLLISLNHQSPFVGLVSGEATFSTVLNKLCEDLRKYVKNSVVYQIRTLNNDRILEINLQKSDDFYVKHDYFLILELIPHHPNLLFLDENRKIIFASHYTELTAKRLILKGQKYVLPENNNSNEEVSSDLTQYKDELMMYVPELESIRLHEKYKKVIDAIKRKLKVATKKVDILNKEIEDANKLLIYQEYGSTLLTLMNDKESLDAYIKENNVPYDEHKSVTDNANILFKKYKKAKETIKVDIIQLVENDHYIHQLYDDLSSMENMEESVYMILANHYTNAHISKKEANAIAPYIVNINGTKIAFGRNSAQNDLLTFKKAKDNYYFFHMENIAGSHVVILKNNPTDHDKENAAMLTVHLANKEAGNVQMAIIKDIKKGQFQGQVLFSKYTTIKINKIDSKIKEALTKTSRMKIID